MNRGKRFVVVDSGDERFNASCTLRRGSSDHAKSLARKNEKPNRPQTRGHRRASLRNRRLFSARLAARRSATRRCACHLGRPEPTAWLKRQITTRDVVPRKFWWKGSGFASFAAAKPKTIFCAAMYWLSQRLRHRPMNLTIADLTFRPTSICSAKSHNRISAAAGSVSAIPSPARSNAVRRSQRNASSVHPASETPIPCFREASSQSQDESRTTSGRSLSM